MSYTKSIIKYFTLIFLLSLNVVGNSFAMRNAQKSLGEYLGFKLLNKIDFNHEGCKAISPSGRYIASRSNKEMIVYDVEEEEKVCSHQHNSFVECVVFHPSDTRLVSGTRDGKVIVYDVDEEEKMCLYRHKNWVECVAHDFSGRYIASGSGDKKVIVYDLVEAEQICSYQHDDTVYCVAFSPSGTYIVSGSKDKRVIVYDIEKKQQICSCQHDDEIECVAFNPSGTQIAFGTYKKVIVYDTEEKVQVYSYQHDDWVKQIVFSPSGTHIASASIDGGVMVYDVEKEEQAYSYQHKSEACCIAFSPSGQHIASVARDKKVVICDVEKKEQTYSYQHDAVVYCIAFCNDGNQFIFVDWRGQVQRISNLQNGFKLLDEIDFGHSNCQAISSSGVNIAFSVGHKIIVYDIKKRPFGAPLARVGTRQGRQICSYQHDDEVESLTFGSSDRLIMSRSKNRKIIIYDIEKKQQIRSYQYNRNEKRCVFSPSGKYVALRSKINPKRIYDVKKKRYLADKEKIVVYDIEKKQPFALRQAQDQGRQVCSYQHDNDIFCVIFSPSGRYIASGGRDNKVIVYDIEKKRKVCSYQHNKLVLEIAFTLSGRHVASGAHDGEVIVYDIEKKQQVCSYRHDDRHNYEIAIVVFSSSGRYVASGADDGQVIVYDIEKKQQICSYESCWDIKDIAFSNCDRYIASGGTEDGKVIVYDIKKKVKVCSYCHDDETEYIVFGNPLSSLEGGRLISVDESGQVKVWQLPEDSMAEEDVEERVCFIKNEEEIIKNEATTSINMMNNQKLFCFTSLLAIERNRKKVEKEIVLTEKLKNPTQQLFKIQQILKDYIHMLPNLKLIAELQASKLEIIRSELNNTKQQKNGKYKRGGMSKIQEEYLTQKEEKWITRRTIENVETKVETLYKKRKTLMQKRKCIQQKIKALWPVQKKEQPKEIGKKQEQDLEHVLRGVIVSPIVPNPHAGLSKQSFLVQFDNAKKLTVCNAFPEVINKLKRNMNVIIHPKTMMIVGHIS